MAKQPKGELVPVVVGFNYDVLEAKVAEQVRSSADRIRERVKKTVEDIIDVGNDLLAVKEALPHSQFGPWLKAEFGWSERSAQNFMSVAEKFKSARIAGFPSSPAPPAFWRHPRSRTRPARSPSRRPRPAKRSPSPRPGRSWLRRRRSGDRGGRRRSPPTSWACGW